MGGTSFDIAMVVEGSTRFYQFAPTIDRWTIDATILDSKSIGSGGGSIARVDALLGNRLSVGPESAGSIPGPAAYDQGGRDPTVTDADLVLGYLSPERFHGGQLTLNPRRAERAIRERVAGQLEHRGARGGAADEADHRRQDGRRDLQGDGAQGL